MSIATSITNLTIVGVCIGRIYAFVLRARGVITGVPVICELIAASYCVFARILRY